MELIQFSLYIERIINSSELGRELFYDLWLPIPPAYVYNRWNDEMREWRRENREQRTGNRE
jgi:hypothetical protein